MAASSNSATASSGKLTPPRTLPQTRSIQAGCNNSRGIAAASTVTA
jgi:hypothetical protein